MKLALILVDIQKDYFKGGKFELANAESAAENTRKVLDYFRGNSYPVIHVQHTSVRENAAFFVKGTSGVEIYDEVAPIDGEYVVQKNYPNSFFKTNLSSILEKENTKDIVVCGMMSHMCIDSTVRASFELGYNCALLEDCCATRDLKFGDNIISWKDVHGSFMTALASFAKVTNSEKFLKEMTA
jgi:nicotinamidase-related amidase